MFAFGASLWACQPPDGAQAGNEQSGDSVVPSLPSPQEIARRSMGSTVVLTMRDRQSQPLSMGTGFFVADNVVATNAHVIAGTSTGSVKILGSEKSHDVIGLVALDQEHDLALLLLQTSRPPLRLAQGPLPEIGEEVYALGNPEGLEGTFSQGIISAHRIIREDTLLQLTAPISPGSSGGPILSSSGDVVGVAVATFREGQNLNFAIPVKWVSSLLTVKGKPRSLETVSPTPRGRASTWAGAGATAVSGENFQWDGEFDFQSGYTFSVRNKSADDIRDIYCLVVFYDRGGKPLEADWVYYAGPIPAGLAQRIASKVDPSVKRLTTPVVDYLRYSYRPSTRVEYRVLKYTIAR